MKLNEIERLKIENERLRILLNEARERIGPAGVKVLERGITFREENTKLRQALLFYADKSTDFESYWDGGRRAREALGIKEKPEMATFVVPSDAVPKGEVKVMRNGVEVARFVNVGESIQIGDKTLTNEGPTPIYVGPADKK